jgi:response regulator RpfG family c-di-GMP phosphodiesterase
MGQRVIAELERLAEVTSSAPDDVIEAAMSAAHEMLGMEMAFVSTFVDDGQRIDMVAGDASSFGLAAGSAVAVEDSYCRLMARGEIEQLVPDARADDRTRHMAATARSDIGAYVGVPLTLPNGHVYGSFCCVSHGTRGELDERDVKFMHVLARMVASQIEREGVERANRRLEAQADSSQALMAALEAREQYTGDHSKAVFDLSVAVARTLGLSEDDVIDIGQVALLHDIGKVGVPDAVLQKPGPLDDAEWTIMREHPAIGARIVASIDGLAHLAPAIRAEHERWDGGGYPDGLAGDQIPLASQICLVCDSWHAMTSDRPYRAAMPASDALEELLTNAGSQFSPPIVDALVAVLELSAAAA